MRQKTLVIAKGAVRKAGMVSGIEGSSPDHAIIGTAMITTLN